MKKGIGAFTGYAIGTAYIILPPEDTLFQALANDPSNETESLEAAIEIQGSDA
jgi:hypothetical protein